MLSGGAPAEVLGEAAVPRALKLWVRVACPRCYRVYSAQLLKSTFDVAGGVEVNYGEHQVLA